MTFSADSNYWDGPLVEVVGVPVTVTKWRTK